jgi:hypothetical protein
MSAGTANLHWPRNNLSGMLVVEGELAAVTGDDSDVPQLDALKPVLNRLRGAFGMEMVFIGELRDGVLMGRHSLPNCGCNPFEEAYGRELLESRCGASLFEAMPVCSQEGIESGTLVCGVAAGEGYQPPPDSLQSVSRLLATSMRRMPCTARA